jgi:hypothetical protein
MVARHSQVSNHGLTHMAFPRNGHRQKIVLYELKNPWP